jgi:hypothetical protein
MRKHYAKRLPSIEYAFGLFLENNLVGVCTFGQPASHNVNKGICGENYSKYVVELNRLIVNEGLDKNALSFFVSSCLKGIKEQKIIVSYADSSMHNGYIYQSTNFIYTGKGTPRTHLGAADGKHPRHYIKNNEERTEWQPKHRYIFIIGSKRFKKEVMGCMLYKPLPYPKGENIRYDASYKPHIQNRLF